MPTIECPFCGALGSFRVAWKVDAPLSLGYAGNQGYELCSAQCPNETCQAAVVMVSRGGLAVQAWPKRLGGRKFPDVPEHIADAADEAFRCHSVGALRASVLLARSVVEATAKEKGITQGNLLTKIDEMHSQQLIRPDVREGAHEVRYLGNTMAHGDFVDPVDAAEADLMLLLMCEVLDEVFQAPARVAAARAARQAKLAAPGNP